MYRSIKSIKVAMRCAPRDIEIIAVSDKIKNSKLPQIEVVTKKTNTMPKRPNKIVDISDNLDKRLNKAIVKEKCKDMGMSDRLLRRFYPSDADDTHD